MPIVVKAKQNDSTSDLIRKFKKITSAIDIVNKVRDRAFHKKPSQLKTERGNEKRRIRKRLRSLKKMKNISPKAIERLSQKI